MVTDLAMDASEALRRHDVVYDTTAMIVLDLRS